eukprot:GHVQ01001929.1.p1 GENE.GHVQ01001929.1~~GHVQ01001929.1.p1  ORF type:complete len:189 (-),score=53.35 GHVQ01001929.1:14-580(-)
MDEYPTEITEEMLTHGSTRAITHILRKLIVYVDADGVVVNPVPSLTRGGGGGGRLRSRERVGGGIGGGMSVENGQRERDNLRGKEGDDEGCTTTEEEERKGGKRKRGGGAGGGCLNLLVDPVERLEAIRWSDGRLEVKVTWKSHLQRDTWEAISFLKDYADRTDVLQNCYIREKMKIEEWLKRVEDQR